MTAQAGKTLNERGQCCGRKPLSYKRPPHLFCMRCDAAFDVKSGKQIPNWAYISVGDERFVSCTTRSTASLQVRGGK